MATFRIIQRVPVVVHEVRVLFETDDWLEAEAEVANLIARAARGSRTGTLPEIKGVHPTHDFDTRSTICHNDGCGAWNNGSYGSHAPCGTEFTTSLAQMIAERGQSLPEE